MSRNKPAAAPGRPVQYPIKTQVSLSAELMGAVVSIAATEDRPTSAMIRVLVVEALTARAEQVAEA